MLFLQSGNNYFSRVLDFFNLYYLSSDTVKAVRILFNIACDNFFCSFNL